VQENVVGFTVFPVVATKSAKFLVVTPFGEGTVFLWPTKNPSSQFPA
jgi:hypothetical protein